MIHEITGFRKAIRNMCQIAFFLLFFFLSQTSKTQTYFFDLYSVQQGLAQSKVYTIIQDKNDYIWIGTDGGVSRFDGVLFENFTTEDGLAINGVQAIIQDNSGTIWFGHKSGGITRYNGKNFERLDSLSQLLKSDITSFSIDQDRKLWIATAGK